MTITQMLALRLLEALRKEHDANNTDVDETDNDCETCALIARAEREI